MTESVCALLVFAKVPVPGQVKTRLTTLLTPEDAAAVYTAFLQDALAQYATLEAEVLLFLGPSAAPVPGDLWPAALPVLTQQGAGLGERMQHAFATAFARGATCAVIIGTDHPTLPSAYIEAAFAHLAHPHRLVIGPSEDGGYYLLGMNAPHPVLFENMTYSHAEVFAQTRRRMAQTGASVLELPTWYDVDTPADLRRLMAALPDSPAALPHTRALATILCKRYPALC